MSDLSLHVPDFADVALTTEAAEASISDALQSGAVRIIDCPCEDADGRDLPIYHTLGLLPGHAELILVGDLPADTARGLMHQLAAMVMDGRLFAHGERAVDVRPGAVFFFEDASVSVDIAPLLRAAHGDGHIPLLQVLWPDRDGRFPLLENYDVHGARQPRLSHCAVDLNA